MIHQRAELFEYLFHLISNFLNALNKAAFPDPLIHQLDFAGLPGFIEP
jgi:hypothetical protein